MNIYSEDNNHDLNNSEIAIIAMAGRFPGAKDIEQFWLNLRNGVDSISWFTDEELLDSGVDQNLLRNSNYVKASPILSDIELFDANFFAYSAKEAEMIDPQQRLFLELAWEATEKAGYDPQTYNGLIGIYAGVKINSYLLNNLIPHYQFSETVNVFQLGISSDKDFLPTRVAYKLNLTGPAVNVQSACSTSLVAVHLACQSLLNGECDMALAGGVALSVPQKTGYLYQEEMILSPDGHCRTFDAKAQGTIGGSGVGIVVLKRLKDAIADHDHIHAIIKGSAINNDGATKVGYTAPSVSGQAAVIGEAQAIAGVDAETISYIEAHGTATPLGDPIEIAALTQAFTQSTDKKGFCAIGSVKTNLGHLDTAAGVTGLIKTVLALQHKMLPPSLHFETPSPKIDFANSPFYVNTTLSEWKTNNSPRRAGVSSFGIGGTNAHVILEEAPVQVKSQKSKGASALGGSATPVASTGGTPARRWLDLKQLAFKSEYFLLCLSAKSENALEETTINLITHLKEHPELNLGDVVYTLNSGRRGFNHRRMLICHELEDAVKALSSLDPKQVFTNYTEITERSVVFMFPGQGSQYINMAREIYQTQTVFREQVDYCAEILKPQLGLDLRHIIYPSEEKIDEASKQLQQTAMSQPALFVIEYALAKLWQSWGVHPTSAIGHSIGEYVAATLAGVFSLENALSLVAARGQMMQQLERGAMLSVPLPEDKVKSLLGLELSLAAINQPLQCVVSGSIAAVDALQNQLAAQGIECRRLHTNHAFHSQMMEPMLVAFGERVKKVTLNSPKIPYISNLTGTWITVTQATNSDYYVQHLRSTVLFASGVEKLLTTPEQILLEVGPGNTLTTLAKRHPDKAAAQTILTSVRHPREEKSDHHVLLTTFGQLWLAGVKVDWFGFYSQEEYYRLPLPTYPFERQRYWIEPPKKDAPSSQVTLSKKAAIADWFYIPSWKRSPLLPHQLGESLGSVLLFMSECNLGSQVAKQLQQNSQKVIIVKVGDSFRKENQNSYTLNPKQPKDYETLLAELGESIPQTIVHLWSLTDKTQVSSELSGIDQALDLGFYSLLFLAQAFGKQNVTHEVKIAVISNNVQEVIGVEVLFPEKATILGPIKVISQEYPNISCSHIDVIVPESGSWQEQKIIDQLLEEIKAKSADQAIAYRGFHRWTQTFEPIQLDESQEVRLRKGGVYLITGGLGGIGLVLAEHLAETLQAKLILIGRSTFPPPEEWEQWLSTHDDQDSISRKIRKIQELEKLGAEVLVIIADVANQQQMQIAIARTKKRFGVIHGVIHAAGNIGEMTFRTIEQTSYRECEQQFKPKIHGLLVLKKVLQEEKELEFCLLLSSLSSVLGGLGFIAYSAANIFMDAFAGQRHQTSSVLWISVNWDSWELQPQNQQSTSFGASLAEFALAQSGAGIAPQEGVQAFQRILSWGKSNQVIVSTGSLQARINQWLKIASPAKPNNFQLENLSTLHSRPNLPNSYVAPLNLVEQKIADIWQELLGIKQVGIHDNFFELGGDSIIAVQIMSRLRNIFSIQLSVASLFESPTIAEIATNLEKQKTELDTNLGLIDREEIAI